MFKLLQSIVSLFASKHASTEVIDAGYTVEQAIDLVIDGTDPKLRLVSSYQEMLQKEVTSALVYINALVEEIPGPIYMSRKTFISNPEVRAYFATPDSMQEIVSCGTELKNFFDLLENSDSDQCCAMLCAQKEEKHSVGATLVDDVLRKDVLQTSLNFFDYKVMSPALSPQDVRCGIKRCMFDGLVTYALQHIANIRSEREDLLDQRRILHSQLRSRQSHSGGLNAMLAEVTFNTEQVSQIQQKIKQAEVRLETMTGEQDVLSFYLQEIRKVISQPERFIKINKTCMRLNDMGIEVDDSHLGTKEICFSEVEILNVMKRVVVIICYDRNELTCHQKTF